MNSHGNARLARAEIIDETSQESFPASDPPSWTGMASGAPRSPGTRAASSGRRPAAGHAVRLERAYEAPGTDDGLRVLVDRLWPRGLRKADARVDLWLKDIAPSDSLRRWFGHDPARWAEFKRRYRAELEANPEARGRLEELREKGTVTLLFAAHDADRNNAVALKEFLEQG